MTLTEVRDEINALEILNSLRQANPCSLGYRLLYSATLHVGKRIGKHWLILSVGVKTHRG